MTHTGYSGRPQAAKLGLKPGLRVALHDAPQGWALTDPPDGLDGPGPNGEADVIVAFFTEAAEIGRQIAGLGRRIYPAGGLWIAWPRRAAGHRSDITDNVIREIVLPLGLVDVKVAAIDENWSGLRMVWRTENRQLGARAVLRAGHQVRRRAHVAVDLHLHRSDLLRPADLDRRVLERRRQPALRRQYNRVLISGARVTMAPWVSLDVEGLHFPFSPSRSRSSSPTSWLTGPREPRSRLSGTTWG